MDTRRPEAISQLLVERLRVDDVDGLEHLYEPDAAFVDYDGVVKGWAAIRTAHQRFADAGLQLSLNNFVVFEADDLALVHWSWTVRDKAGSAQQGTSAEVLRRQPDGSWKFVIDNSDGSALVGHL